MSATTPYPIRLPEPQTKALKDASSETGLSFPETIRQSITYGLPIVRRKFTKRKPQ